MNHRGLQRALFRMQLDPGFAARIRARDPEAESSTRLGAVELGWLRELEPAALSADREGRRRAQLLRNVAGEFELSCAAAREPEWLEGFFCSTHFHRAIAQDASLPLAFAEHARERAVRGGALLASLVALEAALARARRGERAVLAPPRGALLLSPRAWLVDLAQGTFAWASALRDALDRGAPVPDAPCPGDGLETVLVSSAPPSSAFGLREARAERLAQAVAAFLRACEAGLDASARAAFCREHAIDPAELDALVEDFAADGILLGAA